MKYPHDPEFVLTCEGRSIYLRANKYERKTLEQQLYQSVELEFPALFLFYVAYPAISHLSE